MAFVNLQRLMALNADKGEEMAQEAIGKDGALTNSAEASIGHLRGGLDNGAEAASRVQQAQARAKTLSGSGAAGSLDGGGALDAALMGQSGAMQQYQQRTKNLTKLLGGAQQAQASQQHQREANANFSRLTGQADAQDAQRRRESQRQRDAKYGRATAGSQNVKNRFGGGYDPKGADPYNPQGADEYTAYSDWIKTGRR